MTCSSRTRIGLVALALAIAAVGCDTYRIETVLYPDGSVDRAIYQPEMDTPTDARNAEHWKQVTFAPSPDASEKEGWSGLIRDLPLREANKDRTYIAAWGHFPSPDQIPDHVEFKAPEGSKVPAGKLVRTYKKNDYLFVVEYEWRETLTDVVTLGDMRKAREELADLMLKVGEDIFNEAVGPAYDSAELFKWLRSEGKTMLAEATDACFVQLAARKNRAGQEALEDELANILERHGLALKKQGKWLADEAKIKALDDFAVTQIVRGVRVKKDGTQVDKEMAALWWEEMTNRTDKKNEQNRFEKAAKKVIDAKYGGEKALDQRLQALQVRVSGLYKNSLILPAPTNGHAFHNTLTMPGEVVAANGAILSGNRVRWKFAADEAYPLGYEMTCRSLVAQVQNQKDLLKGQPLADRETMLEFIDQVKRNDKLIGALEACRKDKSMAPLYEVRKENVDIDRLIKLLKLPASSGQ
jgi:hypothetical protein